MRIIPNQKGVYALIVEVPEEKFITVGKLGGYLFEPGFYAYIGSAQRGLRVRFKRHLNKKKKKHWHIDYLLDETILQAGIFSITADRIECQVAQKLGTRLFSIPGFGVSDCTCESHLFHHPEREMLQKEIIYAFSPYLCSVILF